MFSGDLNRGQRKYCVKLWILFLYFIHCFTGYSLSDPEDSDTPVQAGTQTILPLQKMKEDLDYTVRIMKNVHPATYHGFSHQQKTLIESAYSDIQTPQTVTSFYFIINSLLCSFQDAHTMLWRRGVNPDNKQIDATILCLHDGFWIIEDCHPFKRGDKVVGIGDKSIDLICQQMQSVISAENEFWRKMYTASLIRAQEFLEYLQVLDDDNVRVCVERAGNKMWLTAPLKPTAPDKGRISSRPWISYDIYEDISLGIFSFDMCRLDDKFREELRTFFTEVSKKKIENIAVDLRRNSGGVSTVTGEFMKYIDIEKYKIPRAEMRYSKEIAEKTGYTKTSGYVRAKKNTEVRNERVKDSHLLFRGKLFVLTSAMTFSSANYFAMTIKDNNLGTILGEPTGNAPTAYGDAREFHLPNTGFIFMMSHKKFTRPNPQNDPEDSLYPDIPVYTTIQDVLDKKDPQIDRLKQIVKKIPE